MTPPLIYDEARGETVLDAAENHHIDARFEYQRAICMAAMAGDFRAARDYCDKAISAEQVRDLVVVVWRRK